MNYLPKQMLLSFTRRQICGWHAYITRHTTVWDKISCLLYKTVTGKVYRWKSLQSDVATAFCISGWWLLYRRRGYMHIVYTQHPPLRYALPGRLYWKILRMWQKCAERIIKGNVKNIQNILEAKKDTELVKSKENFI